MAYLGLGAETEPTGLKELLGKGTVPCIECLQNFAIMWGLPKSGDTSLKGRLGVFYSVLKICNA